MHPSFLAHAEHLDLKFQELMEMEPLTFETLPKTTPEGGVYLFSNGDEHLYVGRTKRALGTRVRNHISSASDCPFAWHLARRAHGVVRSYRGQHTRKNLLADPAFKGHYVDAKALITQMEIRWVHEPRPTAQALLEIYAATVLGTPFNDFGTS